MSINQTIERTALGQLVSNEEFARKALPHMKGDYFSDKTEKTIFEEITKFVDKYNKIPTQTSLEIEVQSRKDLNEEEYKKVVAVIQTLESTDVDFDWLVDTTEQFCKDKAVYNAIVKGIQIIDGKDKNRDVILKRLGIGKGTFCEFGVGDGTENNTLILLALGWSGVWIGGQDIVLDTQNSSKLRFIKSWITKENILNLYSSHSAQVVDVVSMDLDGNDLHLAEELLKNGVSPKLFIAEYNARFPPQVQFSIPYDAEHIWLADDYFGASLASFVQLFDKFGYQLICCNAATGSNAFFVKEEFVEKFPEVPEDIEKLYSEPFYLPYLKTRPTSVRTLQSFL